MFPTQQTKNYSEKGTSTFNLLSFYRIFQEAIKLAKLKKKKKEFAKLGLKYNPEDEEEEEEEEAPKMKIVNPKIVRVKVNMFNLFLF